MISAETTYTDRASFNDARFGRGDSLAENYTIDRRFLLSGKWYLRLGGEYERFNFGGTKNGLPNQLQAISGHIALEYVMRDQAAAGVEIEPGVYFQNHISTDAFDIPWKIYTLFPIVKDKLYGAVGAAGALHQDPVVLPGGGALWFINDKWRLEALFPRPALVYTPNDSWEYRLLGQFVSGSFRTDSLQNAASGIRLQNAIVQYSEYRAGVQVSYNGFKAFSIVAGVGESFRRSFDYFRVGLLESVGAAPYCQLSIKAKF